MNLQHFYGSESHDDNSLLKTIDLSHRYIFLVAVSFTNKLGILFAAPNTTAADPFHYVTPQRDLAFSEREKTTL